MDKNYKMIDGKKYLYDGKMALVSEDAIKPVDLLRDQLVLDIQDKVMAMKRKMEDTKRECLNDIETFMSLAAAEYGVTLGGKKGNVQLSSFDGKTRVLLAISDSLDLTEGIYAAKQLIDEYLTDLTRDSSSDLKTLISQAFRVKQGKMDVKRILELRSYNITDPRWKQAMDIISDSIKIASSKQCFRIHTRKGEEGFQQLNLDFSTI